MEERLTLAGMLVTLSVVLELTFTLFLERRHTSS
jgi:hypothetical protein